jgi:hypothetical protein
VQDIAGELSINVVVQYLRLWHELQDVQLSDGSNTVVMPYL